MGDKKGDPMASSRTPIQRFAIPIIRLREYCVKYVIAIRNYDGCSVGQTRRRQQGLKPNTIFYRLTQPEGCSARLKSLRKNNSFTMFRQGEYGDTDPRLDAKLRVCRG